MIFSVMLSVTRHQIVKVAIVVNLVYTYLTKETEDSLRV